MYPHTRNKLCRLRLSEVRALQTDSTYRDRQTDVTKCIVVPHSQAITRSDTIQNVISNCSGHTDVENFWCNIKKLKWLNNSGVKCPYFWRAGPLTNTVWTWPRPTAVEFQSILSDLSTVHSCDQWTNHEAAYASAWALHAPVVQCVDKNWYYFIALVILLHRRTFTYLLFLLPNGIIMSVICSPAAAMFATCSFDQTAKLWSTERGFPLRTFIGHTRSVNVSLSLCLFANVNRLFTPVTTSEDVLFITAYCLVCTLCTVPFSAVKTSLFISPSAFSFLNKSLSLI